MTERRLRESIATMMSEATGEAASGELSAAIGRSAMRKASLRILPLIALGYGTAYMDRANISFAALQMNADLHFSATAYGLGAGLFFLSYAACEIPSNVMMHRYGARLWLARIMVTWGVIAMAMALVRTPGQFYTVRFLLGMAEAGFFPGVIYYFMSWFPAEIRARAFSRFYISLPLSSVVMGALAGTLMGLDGHLGLRGWQWLFLVEGLPPIVLGVVFYFLLPSHPDEVAWLSVDEKRWIRERTMADADAHGSSTIGAALRNPRVWEMGCFCFVMLMSSYAYTFTSPTIVQSVTGLSTTQVGFVIAGLSVLAAAAMLLGGIVSDRRTAAERRDGRLRRTDRFLHTLPWCLVVSTGFLMYGRGHAAAVVLCGLGLVMIGYNGMQGPLYAVPSLILRDPGGRGAAAGVAAINMIGMLGGFVGPYWMGYMKDLTGNYHRGLVTMALPMLLGAGILLWMRSRVALQASAATSTGD